MDNNLNSTKRNISILLSLAIIFAPSSSAFAGKRGKNSALDSTAIASSQKGAPKRSPKSKNNEDEKKSTINIKGKVGKKDHHPPDFSFTNPKRNGKLEPYSQLQVDYKNKKPVLPGLYDQYILGPVIGDGNCFIYAAFTQENEDADAMLKISGDLRSQIVNIVRGDPNYIEIMRHELLAEHKTHEIDKKYKVQELSDNLTSNNNYEKLREVTRELFANDFSHQKFAKPYEHLNKEDKEEIEDQVLLQLPDCLKEDARYTDDELLDLIPDVAVEKYVTRYKDNSGKPSSYIEIPVGRGEQSSIAQVIAKSSDTLIHCFLYDSAKKNLNYKDSLGNQESKQVVSILCDTSGSHFWTLYNQAESEKRHKGVIQTAKNYESWIEGDSSSYIDSLVKETSELNVSSTQSSSLSTLQESLEVKDPFFWQIGQHYRYLANTFEQISFDELISVIGKIIKVIQLHSDYFKNYYDALFYNLREVVHNWILEHVLTLEHFYDEQTSASLTSSENEEEEEGDNAWRSDFMRGYDGESEEEENEGEIESDNENPTTNSKNKSISPYTEEDEYETSTRGFEQWQLRKLNEMFYINLSSLDDFTSNSLDTNSIHKFLTQYVEGGDYSWLINDYVEGSYETSYDFVRKYHKEIGVETKLLDTIFAGLWFDYDWEKFDIRDPLFISKTYVQTLYDFIQGNIGHDVRKHIENALQQTLFYQPDDFKTPFEQLKIDYNKFAKQHDWRSALVVWSVYSTYRKIFTQKGLDQEVSRKSAPFETISQFNREEFLLRQLGVSLVRAQQYYTKVYPHPDTDKVVYRSKRNSEKSATLDLKSALSQLKFVGNEVEKHRPKENGKQRKNVLVPRLYFVISDQPHLKKESSKHKRIFVPIELDQLDFPAKPLTSNPSDGIFTGIKNKAKYYSKKAEEDYVNGQIIRGLSKDKANEIFKKATERELVHSERVWLELLRNESFVNEIIEKLRVKVSSRFPGGYEGKVKVYSVLALLYSTNSVCPFCTPSLIAGQNSHKNGEFLSLLSEKLNQEGKEKFLFKTRGYDAHKKTQNPAKFRLHTIVTATTNFESEAHDLTDTGQHNHPTVGKNKPPATHNPHAKLFFDENAIDLHQEPRQANGELEPQQRYFFEFVGKDLHKSENVPLPFQGIVFSSGSQPWEVPATVLTKSVKKKTRRKT